MVLCLVSRGMFMTDRVAWLALAVSGKRQHGGNDGYDDDPSCYYSWDDTVPNSSTVAVGDVIVVWDKVTLLGVSVIEDILTGTATKLVHRCAHCHLSGIKPRENKSPRYKCYKCKRTFEKPDSHEKQVVTYRSRHDATWVDLSGCLSGVELRKLAVSPKSQLSLRPLNWAAFTAAVVSELGSFPEPLLETTQKRLVGGHKRATVRVRLGQAQFRHSLLTAHGSSCAFTGPAPAFVLEAAHLYSYATHGQHHVHGGLLLRRDIHRLFDLGQLAVHPETGTIDVSPAIRTYPEYGRLHGAKLQAPVTDKHRRWFADHWRTYRTDPEIRV
ncbi:HNH endonuclease signature motif containing protein [Actinoallomurus sp. NPDC052308]|uniref:HNH endonuclease n=1 Tax=Actinoallomurus sp. NPDC052308 TaxID=3155530 RepID=UPI00343FC1E4